MKTPEPRLRILTVALAVAAAAASLFMVRASVARAQSVLFLSSDARKAELFTNVIDEGNVFGASLDADDIRGLFA